MEPEVAPEPLQVEDPIAPVQTAEVMTFKTPRTIAKPKSTYPQRMEEDKRQLSLF